MNSISLIEIIDKHKTNMSDYYLSIINNGNKLFWDNILNSWVVTGYYECSELIDSKLLSKSRLALTVNDEDNELVKFVQNILDAQMMFCEGNEVRERRRYWGRQINFDRQSEDGNQINLKEVAKSIIEKFLMVDNFNLYDELLRQYVSKTVCYSLKLTEEERVKLYPMIMHYVRFLDGKLNSPKALKYSLVSIINLYSKLASKIDSFPSTDVARHKWISDYILMIVAGHESAAYLLATILIQRQKSSTSSHSLIQQQKVSKSYIQESLRFDSPVQLIGRKAISSFTLNGKKIKTNDRVFLHIGAANRDPLMFEKPNDFIIGRKEVPLLSFGLGTTRCIGSSFAMQICEAFLNVMDSMNLKIDIDLQNVCWDNGIAGRNFNIIPAKFQDQRSI